MKFRSSILAFLLILMLFASLLLLPSCGSDSRLPAGIHLSGTLTDPDTGAVVGVSTSGDGTVSGSLKVPLKDANGNPVGYVGLSTRSNK